MGVDIIKALQLVAYCIRLFTKPSRLAGRALFIQIRGKRMSKDVTGSAMVVGGGIAGMLSALDLANSGYYVYLVEKGPSIGGITAQLDKTFPTNDCAM